MHPYLVITWSEMRPEDEEFLVLPDAVPDDQLESLCVEMFLVLGLPDADVTTLEAVEVSRERRGLRKLPSSWM